MGDRQHALKNYISKMEQDLVGHVDLRSEFEVQNLHKQMVLSRLIGNHFLKRLAREMYTHYSQNQ